MIPNLLNDIIATGLTEAEVGKVIGRDQSSVNRMRHNKQRCDYQTGVKIEALHRERCPAGDGIPPGATRPEQRAA